MPDIRTSIRSFHWKLKGAGRDLGMITGSTGSHFRNARGQRILIYHGLCKRDHLRYNTIFVKQKMFERQLQLFKKFFNVLSLDDYFSGNFSSDRFNICLTFDDGFANNYHCVLPLLEKYEVPAAFFITAIRMEGYDILWNDMLAIARQTGPPSLELAGQNFVKGKTGVYFSVQTGVQLDTFLRAQDFTFKKEMIGLLHGYCSKAPAEYWMQLTPGEITSLASSKWVTIGAHGKYHNDLAMLPGTVVTPELCQAKKFLEDVSGKPVNALAFPYGSCSSETIQLAKKAGYTQLLTTELPGVEAVSGVVVHERMTVNPFISATNQLYAAIKGHYD